MSGTTSLKSRVIYHCACGMEGCTSQVVIYTDPGTGELGISWGPDYGDSIVLNQMQSNHLLDILKGLAETTPESELDC